MNIYIYTGNGLHCIVYVQIRSFLSNILVIMSQHMRYAYAVELLFRIANLLLCSYNTFVVF